MIHSTASKTIFRTTASLSAVTVFALAGCSAQAVPDEDRPDDEAVDSTSSAVVTCSVADYNPSCPSSGNAVNSHRQASRYMKYVFGDNSAAPKPYTSGIGNQMACDKVKSKLDTLRSRINAGSVSIQRSTGPVCGRSSAIFTLRPTNGVQIFNATELNALWTDMTSCDGWAGTGAFSVPDAVYTSNYFCTPTEINQLTFVRLDPEPATLSANLSGSNYAYAAAVTQSGLQETAHRWPSTGTYTTSLVNNGAGQSVQAQTLAGRPCLTGTTTASAGTVVNPRLAAIGSKVYCK